MNQFNPHQLVRAIQAFTAPLSRKLKIILQRAVLVRAGYRGKRRLLQLQVEGDQTLADIEHLEPFGFTSHPLNGAEAVALSFNGNGSHTVALLIGDARYRLEVTEGETAIYNQQGDKVHIRADRSIEIQSANKVLVNAPELYCSGVIRAQDVISHSNVSLINHRHNETNGATTHKANPS